MPIPSPQRSQALRRALVVLVALLVAQAVWILAVPPFRGIDEIDHVYRASGAASGQVHLTHTTVDGRGQLVWVPTDIVRAAHAQCVSRLHATEAECAPLKESGGRSLVPTSAGTYDPLFYLVVGTVAKPFHGAAADYAMRFATALLCALLISLGVGALSLAGAGRWAMLGVAASLTPEVLFSGAIVAPNGPEISLGFLLWGALLAVFRQVDGTRAQRGLLLLAGGAAVPLTFLRQLGPLWILMVVAGVVVVFGLARTRRLVTSNRALVVTVSAALVAGLVWRFAWQHLAAHTTGGGGAPVPVDPEWARAFDVPLFCLQMVGAFPVREIPAPLVVYPLWFLVVGFLLFATLRSAVSARTRRTVVIMVCATLVVPVVLSLAFMTSVGAIWQGRYALPFVIGILPLVGLALDDAKFEPRDAGRWVFGAGVLLTVSQAVCPYHVQQLELARVASRTDPSWWHVPGPVLIALMVMACGISWLGMRRTYVERTSAQTGSSRESTLVPSAARPRITDRPRS